MPVEVSRPSAAWVPKLARGAQFVEGPLQGSSQAAPAQGLGVDTHRECSACPLSALAVPGEPRASSKLSSLNLLRGLMAPDAQETRSTPSLPPPCPSRLTRPAPLPTGPCPTPPLTRRAQQAGALQHGSRRQPRTHCCVPGSPVPGLAGLQAAVSGQREQSEACSGPPHLSVAFSSLVPSGGALGGPGGRLAMAQRGHRPGGLPRCPRAHLCSCPGASPRCGKPWL